jgi:hypothetical protein
VFPIVIQNDGTVADSFKVVGAASARAYSVTYARGATNITSSIVAGTFQTPSLAPGAAYALTARVKVLNNAAVGSSVTRVVRVRSVGDRSKVDVVKFVGKRR